MLFMEKLKLYLNSHVVTPLVNIFRGHFNELLLSFITVCIS